MKDWHNINLQRKFTKKREYKFNFSRINQDERIQILINLEVSKELSNIKKPITSELVESLEKLRAICTNDMLVVIGDENHEHINKLIVLFENCTVLKKGKGCSESTCAKLCEDLLSLLKHFHNIIENDRSIKPYHYSIHCL